MTCIGIFTTVSATFPVADPTLLSTLDSSSLEVLAHSIGYLKTSSSDAMGFINGNMPISAENISQVSQSIKAYLTNMGYSFEVPVNNTTITEFDKAVGITKNSIAGEYASRIKMGAI